VTFLVLAGVGKLLAGWATVLAIAGVIVLRLRRLVRPLFREPTTNPFDYVPPEERRGFVRTGAFAFAVALTGVATATSVVAVTRGRPWVLLASIPVMVSGPFIFRWVRADPRRR
jgi:hypothetical protein